MNVFLSLSAVVKFAMFLITVGMALGLYLGSLGADRGIQPPGREQTILLTTPCAVEPAP